MRRSARHAHRSSPIVLSILAIVVAAGACSPGPADDDPQTAFWRSMRSLCGQAFEGRLVEGSAADSSALGAPLVLDVWQCYSDELRLAFHAAGDHSRVWLLSPSTDGLVLEHALHGPDGQPQPYSGYGGETGSPGTPTAQTFVPDRETLSNVPTSDGTLWVLEIVPDDRITYRLRSPRTVDFRVDFDLRRRAGRQPAPWGFTRRR
jgi:hypothetical protein